MKRKYEIPPLEHLRNDFIWGEIVFIPSYKYKKNTFLFWRDGLNGNIFVLAPTGGPSGKLTKSFRRPRRWATAAE